ncbi:MAG TPA: family 10 glycosylhydrolase, partial [bacterium]
MKRVVTILFLMLISQNLFAGDNEEFRATWVITWEHINSGLSAEQNKANIRKILDNHQHANMNAVLWQVRQGGTAYYNSSYEPWGSYAGYANPGYDPLAYAIEEAHKRGMELHAWFNVFQTSSTYQGAPAAEHPEWICRDQGGYPMTSSICVSPGLAAVRDYTIQVAMEIVRKYDIDGLHLDYVRWNEYSNSKLSQSLAKAAEQQPLLDGMITESQIQDLQENLAGRYLYDIEHPYSAGVPQGFSSWEDWWRWSVTEFVRVLHDSIQSVKP